MQQKVILHVNNIIFIYFLFYLAFCEHGCLRKAVIALHLTTDILELLIQAHIDKEEGEAQEEGETDANDTSEANNSNATINTNNDNKQSSNIGNIPTALLLMKHKAHLIMVSI